MRLMTVSQFHTWLDEEEMEGKEEKEAKEVKESEL